MALIPNFFFKSVVAIGAQINEKLKWIGTGFFVGRPENNENEYTIYLVTNYHIVENKKSIFVRINKREQDECKDCEINLIEGETVQFSRHYDADIVAVQVSPRYLDSNGFDYSWFCLDKQSLTVSEMKETDVIEGCLVYSLGFPISLISTNRNTPVCRLGCISRVSNLFCNRNKGMEYLVDLQTIPGNSGSPVINMPEALHIQGTSSNISANLIGIISGTIDYSEKCSDETRVIECDKNSGFAIVHPVDAIKEVIEFEYQRKRER